LETNNNRRAHRIDVDLRVTVTVNSKVLPDYPLPGRLENLSVDGMRISFPFHMDVLESDQLNIALNLPEPFGVIHGLGEIQWKRWNTATQRTVCGVRMANLDMEHMLALQDIIHEVRTSENAD
jgi:c-di-GMP-binding flagellar brake protein YcgR